MHSSIAFSGTLAFLAAVLTAGQAGAQTPPVREPVLHVCSATMPSGVQRLVFVEAQDKQAARRLADRARLVDTAGKRLPPRSVQECIVPAREKFIDPKAAELLVNTPR